MHGGTEDALDQTSDQFEDVSAGLPNAAEPGERRRLILRPQPYRKAALLKTRHGCSSVRQARTHTLATADGLALEIGVTHRLHTSEGACSGSALSWNECSPAQRVQASAKCCPRMLK